MRIIFSTNGRKIFQIRKNDIFLATGTDANGKRFKISNKNWLHIKNINIYRGSRWILRDGKRILIERIHN